MSAADIINITIFNGYGLNVVRPFLSEVYIGIETEICSIGHL